MRAFAAAASRVSQALRTRPTARDVRESAAVFVLLAGFCVPFGLANGLFAWTPGPALADVLGVAVVAFFVPALGEELVFRGLALPRPLRLRCARNLARAGVALVVFVAWHPMQVEFGLPTAQPAFVDPRFLTCVALLGLACTVSYARSRSMWPPVAIHWAAVVGWKAFLGG